MNDRLRLVEDEEYANVVAIDRAERQAQHSPAEDRLRWAEALNRLKTASRKVYNLLDASVDIDKELALARKEEREARDDLRSIGRIV